MDSVERYKAAERRRRRTLAILSGLLTAATLAGGVVSLAAFWRDGPSVIVSPDIYRARQFLRRTHRDPGWEEISSEMIAPHEVEITIRCKNPFGGPMIERWTVNVGDEITAGEPDRMLDLH